MALINVGTFGVRQLKTLRWSLTTYFGEEGYLRLKAKPSGRSITTPEGDFQLSGRMYVRDLTERPEIVAPTKITSANGGLPVWVGDGLFLVMTAWMDGICHVYFAHHPDGLVWGHGTADRERDAWEQARDQVEQRLGN